MYPLNIIRIRIGLTILNLLVRLPLRFQQEINGYSLIGGAVILLPVEVDEGVAVEVYGVVVLGLCGVQLLV